jgi:peptide chain release factor 1
MFESVATLVDEYADLETRLADPAVHTDQALARRLGRRYAELRHVVATYRDWLQTGDDLEAALELTADDPSFRAEAESLETRHDELAETLQVLLVPRDALDDSDVILEIKAGEGGEESALFAGDLLRMYLRYAERRGWKAEVLESEQSDLGGYKDVTVAVKAKGQAEPGEAPYARLKYEGGVHRVQRVPATESQGRIHTSAAGVLVLPETEDVEVEIDQNDLRIDVYRSSGPGGQSVNTTDSAVRITHLPTGLVVSCQDEKSQHKNKTKGLKVLRSRLFDLKQQEQQQQIAQERKSQVGTGDRSERIRTYNFPQGRITDHRIGLTLYRLEAMLDGELDELLQGLIAYHRTRALAQA